MMCKKCPHHIRHGKLAADGKNIEFTDRCGLLMKLEKRPKDVDCKKYPFTKGFDYLSCEVYQDIFKPAGNRNDVVPTKDFQYSDALSGSSITDMELL